MKSAPSVIAILCSIALSQEATAPAPREPYREFFADGSLRIERGETVKNGRRIADGPYRRFFDGADDATGPLACSGAYENGLMSGPWATFDEDGTPRTKGEFANGTGKRTGHWIMYWAKDEVAQEGEYSLGLRKGTWTFRDASGAVVAGDSGNYEFKRGKPFADQPDPALKLRPWEAQILGDDLHGLSTRFWPNGVRLLEGEFRHGVRQGPWTLRHYDGTTEQEFVSGWYVDGFRDAPSPAETLERERFAIEEELEAGAIERHQDLMQAPWIPAGFGLSSASPEGRDLRERVIGYAELADDAAAEAAPQILAKGKQALTYLISRLVRFDLQRPEQAHFAGRMVDELIVPLLGGRGWTWSRTGTGSDDARNRATVLRWYTWLTLAGTDERSFYWTWLERQPKDVQLLSVEILDARVEEGTPVAKAPVRKPSAAKATPAAKSPLSPMIWKSSELTRARARVALEEPAQKAVDAALSWIVKHQDADGSWSPGKIAPTCGPTSEGKCGTSGDASFTPATTGWCVLALLGAGNGPSERRDAVIGGVKALMRMQREDRGGLIGESGPAYLYNHAIAMWALGEAAQSVDMPEILGALDAAVRYALRERSARHWELRASPAGENAASLTAAMLCGLRAAHDVDIDFEYPLVLDTNKWLAEQDHSDPLQIAATMYAPVATQPSRWTKGDAEALARTLADRLPAWGDDSKTLDFAYWFWGSQGMAVLEAASREKWRQALLGSVPAHQRKGAKHLDGSFDPLEAHKATGGRLMSTAVLALALEAPVRTNL